NPELPPPDKTLFPTIKVAPAKAWSEGTKPTAAAGLRVDAFAANLEHPRWIYVLPNGDVLVAETNAPPKPDDGKGVRGWIQRGQMEKAGAVTLSANRITLLRDSDGDGIADYRTVFIDGLTSPFGMVLVDDTLYVADSNALVSFHYDPGATHLSGA